MNDSESSIPIESRPIRRIWTDILNSPYFTLELILIFNSLDPMTLRRAHRLYNFLQYMDPLHAMTSAENMTDEELEIMIQSNEMCQRARKQDPY